MPISFSYAGLNALEATATIAADEPEVVKIAYY